MQPPQAAGILNQTNLNSTDNSPLGAATAVVRACTTSFLPSALAAGVSVTGLERLASQCNFNTSNVPDCLRQKLAQFQPAPEVRSADRRPSAAGE